jgi:hypothetical protein
MRLEPLCSATMKYEGESVWLRPFGAAEGAGYGGGTGSLRGKRLSGTLTWSNHPRRREDGVWCPDVHGFINAKDGAKILFEMRGYSVLEKAEGEKRAITAVFLFQAEDAEHRWLNTALAPTEGAIDWEAGEVRLKVYLCVNEAATGPAAGGRSGGRPRRARETSARAIGGERGTHGPNSQGPNPL